MAEVKITASQQVSKANVDVYIKKMLEDILFHKSVLMAALRTRGKIKYNKGGVGKSIIWRPTYRKPQSRAQSNNPSSITFERKAFHKEASLPWRSRNVGMSFTKFDQLVNKGEAKFFDLVTWTVKHYTKSMTEDIRLDLYTDGNSSTDNLMGLASWTGNSSACTTNTPVANPNDTYAGLSTALGNYAGSWTEETGYAWPMGKEGGGGGYDFWSPMGIDVNNSFFTGDTMYENWQEVFNYAETFMEALHGDRIDLWLLPTTWMYDLRSSLKDLQTLEVTQISPLTKMGYKTLSYLGTEIAFEYGTPTSGAKGFGLNFGDEGLEMWSLLGQLIESESDHDITTLEDLRALYSYLQLITWTPATQVYLEEITSAGTHA